MYFSAADRGEMMSMVYNWPAEQVCLLLMFASDVQVFDQFLFPVHCSN